MTAQTLSRIRHVFATSPPHPCHSARVRTGILSRCVHVRRYPSGMTGPTNARDFRYFCVLPPPRLVMYSGTPTPTATTITGRNHKSGDMFAMNGRRQESAWGWTHGKFGNSCKMSTSQCVIISKQLVTIRATATDSLIHASQLTRLLVTLS